MDEARIVTLLEQINSKIDSLVNNVNQIPEIKNQLNQAVADVHSLKSDIASLQQAVQRPS